MINEGKVAVMTRMAAYEAGEGKKDEEVCGYFRSDYVGFQLLKTWIGTSIAFCILACVYLLYRMDDLMGGLYRPDLQELTDLGKKFLIAYVILCGAYLLITYVLAHITYLKARHAMVLFDRELRAVSGETEEEE